MIARPWGVWKTNGEKSLRIRTFDTKEEAIECITRLLGTSLPSYWYEIRRTDQKAQP